MLLPRLLLPTLLVAASAAVTGCEPAGETRSMEVTATAYTMREVETKEGNVGLAAWGDQLDPATPAIAVSRDLIREGLGHMTPVEIEGFWRTHYVLDKMNRRWKKRIDIFMGNDVEAAREWGKRKVTIRWTVPAEE